MRIEGANPWSGIEGLNGSKPDHSSVDSAKEEDTSSVDDAELSADATLASSLHQQLLTLPEIRQTKVSALQNALQAGTYSVSADQIAGAMLNDLKQYTGRS